MNRTEVCFVWVIIFALAGLLFFLERSRPSDAEIEATRVKLGCVATNEFVGKDGDRLYLCNDGLKYKWASILKAAYEEKNK